MCIAPNRFLVQEGVHDEFVAKMAERIRGLRVGDGLDPKTNLGPLINPSARDKVGGGGGSCFLCFTALVVDVFEADVSRCFQEVG